MDIAYKVFQEEIIVNCILIASLLNMRTFCKGDGILLRPVDLQLENIKSLIPTNHIMILLPFNAAVEIYIRVENAFLILQKVYGLLRLCTLFNSK